MVTNSQDMSLYETAAREQRVPAENSNSNGERRPRSRSRKVQDGSGSARSNKDHCESPKVDKKAGEGSGNARTIADSRTPQVEIDLEKVKQQKKKSKKKAGEGSSNARAVTDSPKKKKKNKKQPTADGNKARESPSNARAIADGPKTNGNLERTGGAEPIVDGNRAREGSSNAQAIDDGHETKVNIERIGEAKPIDDGTKAREGSSNARATADSQKPKVKIERTGEAKPVVDESKAGEGSSNARAIADGHTTQVNIERTGDAKPNDDRKKAREGSSNARAVDDGLSRNERQERRDDRRRQDSNDVELLEVMAEVAAGTSPEVPEHLQIITDINKVMAKIKGSLPARHLVQDKLGQLAALFTSISKENTQLKAENRVLREVKPPKSYASVTQTAAAAPRQLPQVIQKQRVDKRHTVFISSSEGKDAKEIQKILTTSVNPVSDRIKIRSMRSVNKLLIVETGSQGDVEKLQGHKKLEELNIKVELPRKRKPLVIFYDVPSALTDAEFRDGVFAQNLEGEISQEDFARNFKSKFRSGPRGRATVHHVCEVSPELRKLLIGRGRTYVGFTSHPTKDYAVVPRCLTCQDLGHVKKYCQKAAVCAHCGETGHMKSDCQKKDAPAICRPCSLRGRTCNADMKVCPTHKILLDRLVARTDYGE